MATPSESAEPRSSTELPANYFELYKLAVEMADRISARRGLANSFFLTVNTGLAALLGAKELRWYVPAAGILFAVTWWTLLKSYRDLNTAKYAVILELEHQLPARVYGDEWDHLRRARVRFAFRRDVLRSWISQYRELGQVERIVPWAFSVIYASELLREALN